MLNLQGLRQLQVGSMVTMAFWLSACGEAAKPPAAPPALPVSVQTLAPAQVPIQTEVVAQTEGAKQIEVRPRVGGIVLKRLYTEGEPIKAGAPMFLIDPVPYQLQVDQAAAMVAQQKARIEQTAREAQRLKTLLDTRAISQREYDTAVSDNSVAQAQLLQYQAQLREAQLNLSYTTVRAPESGISGRFELSQGALVNANTTLLTSIVQVSPIWVRFSLSESELATLGGHLKPGMVKSVNLVLANGQDYPQTGTLNFSASRIDPTLGTQQLRAEFSNPDQSLLPGQFVRVRLTTGNQAGVFLVPQPAVLSGQQGRFVYVAEKNAQGQTLAAVRPVMDGGWYQDRWILTGGVKAGDQVIVDNLIKVRPGAPVMPQSTPPSSPATPAAT